jgi:hypothetical protein
LAVRLLLVLVAFAVLYGCGQARSQSNTSTEGGITVGKKVAQAELKPVGDSGTSGTAVLKEVGNLGIQVELDVLGLPTKDPNAAYYAQVHEGSCSDERRGEEHEEEYGAGPGTALARVRLDQLVIKTPGLQAHGGHEHSIPEVPFGSIEQPISFGASADGTSSVTSLLEGVETKRLTSGNPEYVHVHGEGSEDAPELACGDLVGASRRGLDEP